MTKLDWPLRLAEYEAALLNARIQRSRAIRARLRALLAAPARWLRRTVSAHFIPRGAGGGMTPRRSA